jgi:hypothetical protein
LPDPVAAARRIARSCVTKSFGCAKQKRRPLRPSEGFSSSSGELFEGVLRHDLVAAEVGRANHDGLALHRADDAAVRVVLLVFAGKVVAVHEEEFRAEEPDAVRTRAMDVLDVLGERDVGEELDRVSVERDRVKLLELLEALLLGGQKLHALACVPALFGGGAQVDELFVRVEQDGHVGLEDLAGALDADQSRNFKRARKNDGMTRNAAFLEDDARDVEVVSAAQKQHVGGIELVGHENYRLVQEGLRRSACP